VRHPFFDVPRPVVIGHRGCAGEAPENTLPSFARALEAGAAILESDVHLTRDGAPVLLHDDRIDRICDGTGRATERTLDELREFDAGYRFTPDGGRSFPFRGAGVQIPTLAEALETFPRARFNLELKERVPGLVEHSVEVIRSAGRESLTLLTAGDDALMAELRTHLAAVDSQMAQGASTGDVVAFLQSLQEGTAPKPGPMALQVPPEFAGQPLVTRAFVDHAHVHGLQIHVWTINDAAEMLRLLDLGVDGIVTDHPGRLAEQIRSRATGA
jgi:glycerophosphoryl diester phosphodiesterase